jgi:putative oxidoreductase
MAPSSTTVGSTGLAGTTHAILRIVAGALYFMHGTPKLLGWFGGMGEDGGSAPLLSLMGLAGVLEVFGGLLILLGLFTRPVALVLALEMIIAYFKAHHPQGPVPYLNGGELPGRERSGTVEPGPQNAAGPVALNGETETATSPPTLKRA